MEAERLAEEVARLVGRFAVALWASHPDLGLQVTLTCLFALKKFVRRAPVMTSSHKGYAEYGLKIIRMRPGTSAYERASCPYRSP
jgi:hypothetical protein